MLTVSWISFGENNIKRPRASGALWRFENILQYIEKKREVQLEGLVTVEGVVT